jgi:hypothetical protein
MAKFKPINKSKQKTSQTRGLIPCLVLILSGIALMSVFFYYMMKSAAQ